MLEYQSAKLENGLKIIVHHDETTPLCTVNLMYGVGSRNEKPDKTGFAHLFEHLMFSGSENAPDFDGPLQRAGAQNNAFTSADLTNYYASLPAINLDTALWLEADRMVGLNITEESLNREKSVVLEEFKQRCLNPPYGLTWHHLSAMIYKNYPYRWPTIGLEPDHIGLADLEDVRSFYEYWYHPRNAILCVAGGVSFDEVYSRAEHYFGDILAPDDWQPTEFPEEEAQTEPQVMISPRAVPVDSFYLAFRACPRLASEYEATDLLSDILAGSKSSRLYRKLVKDKNILTSVEAYISGTIGPGMIVISGKLHPGITHQEAIKAVWEELEALKTENVTDQELNVCIRRLESQEKFSRIKNAHVAIELCYYELLGDAAMANEVLEKYRQVTPEDIKKVASDIFLKKKECRLEYHTEK